MRARGFMKKTLLEEPLKAAGLLVAGVVALAAPVHAETYQQTCRFNYGKTIDEERLEVPIVILTRTKGNGRVIVKGTGEFEAKVNSFSTGETEYAFHKDGADEIIKIDGNGIAIWNIHFPNEGYISHIGRCEKEKRIE